ncbi:hypothetical protein DOTSEDRAFT_26108 [Dothistroma septosporum NZE10]|uniref:Uncharacterized protein n=1 Tax=Dothistroma septosporum (strain NZE10 / CBS 128990) TaxID=675120 RepID=N1PIU7_DOTSN|nr:hypothetical protein DOTSEDRAFT_26108 [Dothistroma septosporum NZE10]
MAVSADPFVTAHRLLEAGKPSPAESIQGLREQILANASALFPQLALRSPSFHTTGLSKPSELFEIITIGNIHKQALLLFGPPLARGIAARGPASKCVAAALAGLLDVLSEALSWYTETLLGELKHGEECAGGQVNFAMVEGGFHFSAGERLARGV